MQRRVNSACLQTPWLVGDMIKTAPRRAPVSRASARARSISSGRTPSSAPQSGSMSGATYTGCAPERTRGETADCKSSTQRCFQVHGLNSDESRILKGLRCGYKLRFCCGRHDGSGSQDRPTGVEAVQGRKSNDLTMGRFPHCRPRVAYNSWRLERLS
jgi:hypothetical protein